MKMDKEREYELNKEGEETYFNSWFSDRKHDLIRDFAKKNKMYISDVGANEDEFMEYANSEFKLHMENK